MKKLLLSLGMAMLAMGSFAQEGSENPHQKGYRGDFAAGTFIDVEGDEGGTGFSFTTSHGYQFNSHIFLGGGLGVTSFNTSESDFNYTMIPVFVDFRWQWLNKRVTPFFDLKIGSSVLSADELDDVYTCFYTSPGLGVSIGLTNKLALNVLFSYDYHTFSADVYDYYGYTDTYNYNIDGPAIKVGLEW